MQTILLWHNEIEWETGISLHMLRKKILKLISNHKLFWKVIHSELMKQLNENTISWVAAKVVLHWKAIEMTDWKLMN